MSLFIDGHISTLDDLKAWESEILDVASTEGIDLSSKLESAAEEIGIELTGFLLAENEPDARELRRVVVTPALKQWHMARTLANSYRDAYHRQLNDRYQGKWQLYAELDRRASDGLERAGVGLVRRPVPQAEKPAVSESENALEPGTYYLRVSWTDAFGQEGQASDAVTFESAGMAPTLQATRPPAEATGWNVYSGWTAADVRRQNQEPLGPGESWTASGSIVADGPAASEGQVPDYYVSIRRILQRG